MLAYTIIIGRMATQPEYKVTPSGIGVTNFPVAVNFKNGEQQETSFLDCVAFGKTAEVICQYIDKGDLLGLEGRLRTRTYETKDGQKRKVTEVVISRCHFLTPKKQNDEEAQEDEFNEE